MSYSSRISHAFKNAPVLPLNNNSRYVIISDCHRGSGNANDNFLKNQNLYLTALSHYYTHGFTYIELGDGDELWENRDMRQIVEIHSSTFRLLSLFYRSCRLYMIYGNHDMVKKKNGYSKSVYHSYFCPDTLCCQPLFPDLKFYEGIILEDSHRGFQLFLTHGHQADFLNSTCWRLARFLVRYLWKPLEHSGVLDPTSAAKNYVRKDKTEQRLDNYAKAHGIHLVTGHTHRPRLNPEAPLYMNTGSCVHPCNITCLEIENQMITLVKWTISVKRDRTLYVVREILSQYPIPSILHSAS